MTITFNDPLSFIAYLLVFGPAIALVWLISWYLLRIFQLKLFLKTFDKPSLSKTTKMLQFYGSVPCFTEEALEAKENSLHQDTTFDDTYGISQKEWLALVLASGVVVIKDGYLRFK